MPARTAIHFKKEVNRLTNLLKKRLYSSLIPMIVFVLILIPIFSVLAAQPAEKQGDTSVTPLVTFEQFNETEPNNTRAQANLVNSSYYGSPMYTLKGTFSNASSDVDYFRFDIIISGEFQAVAVWDGSLTGQKLEHNLTFSLENASGTTIANSILYDGFGSYEQSMTKIIPAGTYYLKVASKSSSTTYNGAAYKVNLYHSADCWVGNQPTPIGPTAGNILTNYDFSAHDHISDCGAPVQTRFDWGDGTFSAWSTNHTRTKSWTNPGTYSIRAQERCPVHTFIVGEWSAPLTLNLDAPLLHLTVETADPAKGSASGSISRIIGNTVTATAFPASGYRFYRWQADSEVKSRNNPYSFALMDNLTLTAHFRTEISDSRLSGSNRYLTAAAISQAGWGKGAQTVVLARGDNYADALAGVPLAYMLNAPVLLTTPSSLPAATRAEITRLGATDVIILGGTGAISAAVQSELETMGLAVDRISGDNRYHTAVCIAEIMGTLGSDLDYALLAVGSDFPDALAAASYAAMNHRPILLTMKTLLPAHTRDAITDLGILDVMIVGGTGVISTDVEDALGTLCKPVRISGSNRYATALALAASFADGVSEFCLATGTDFPDAITGAVLAAKKGTGILLVQGTAATPPAIVQDYLVEEQIEAVTLFGGTGVISAAMASWF